MSYELGVVSFFEGCYGGNKHSSKFNALSAERFILILRNTVYGIQQFQPILALVTFFQGDLQFRDKIFGALRILCFVYVGTHRGSGTEKLAQQGVFYAALLQFAAQKHNIFGKFCIGK